MTNKYLDLLNKVFEGSASTENLAGLMDETMTSFREIQAELTSNNPVKQEKAVQKTLELKRMIESKMHLITEKTGLNLEELTALASNPNNMSPEEWTTVSEVKDKFEEMQGGKTKKQEAAI